MARLTRAETNLLNSLVQKTAWTLADVDALLSLTGAESLNFAPGTRLPYGALARLSALPSLRAVSLDGCPVGDVEVAELADAAPGLTQLHLTSAKITDAALRTIGAGFPQLKELHIGQTAITDSGLPALASLAKLEVLWLDGTAVTDAGLLGLAPAPHLTGMNLKNTAVTDAGKEAHFRAWLAARRGPKYVPPDPADVESCHDLLTAFFEAMNEWERGTIPYTGRGTATDADFEELQKQRDERRRLVGEIFARFLTPRLRKGERDEALTTSKPLTYSAVEFFEDERVSSDRINVITKETFWYRLYACVRTPNGWRIDARRWLNMGRWERDYF
jgi:hypothetical protein